MTEIASRTTLYLALAAALGFAVAWLLATVRNGISLSQVQSECEVAVAELRTEVTAGRERERVLAAAQKSMERTGSARERSLATELEEQRERFLSLSEERSRLVGSQADLDARLTRCQSALAARAAELEKAAERVGQLELLGHRNTELQLSLRELEHFASARASANQELQRHLTLQVEAVNEWEGRFTHLQEEHRRVVSQRDQLAATESRAQARNARREDGAENPRIPVEPGPSRESEAVELRGERAARARLQARLGELEPLTGRVRELERQLAESEQSRTGLVRDLEFEIRALRARIAELEPGRTSEGAARGQGRPAEGRDVAAAGAALELTTRSDERRLALEAEVAVLREVIASRDRELALHGGHDAPQPAAPLAKTARARPRPPGTPDNLQLIRGIGPVLEKLLHRIGVTRFRQIARWNERDIIRIGGKLEGFQDRIRRDRWIESARREHMRKYGRDPLTGDRVPPRR